MRGYEFYLRYRVEHEKIKYVSASGHKDFRRFFKILRALSKVHTKISDHFPKISEDVRRIPKVAEYFRAIFDDVSIYKNKFRFNQQLYLINLIANMTSLILISSHVKISCFHSKRNPCNSLMLYDNVSPIVCRYTG